VAALEDDYTRAPISEAERVMLDYVVQVTRDATRIAPSDHDRLRAVGFDDRAILQITLIAASPTRWAWAETGPATIRDQGCRKPPE